MRREEDAALTSGLAFEDAAAAGIIAAALRSMRPTKKAYRQSAKAREGAYERAESDLAGLSEAADPYRAGLLRERALSKALTSTARARAIEELQDRRSEAAAGRVFNKRNLLATHQANVGKIQLRRAELGKEKGAFRASTLEDLLAAQREAQRQARDSKSLRRSRRANTRLQRDKFRQDRREDALDRQEDAREDRDGGKGDGGSSFTPTQRRAARREFREAVALIRSQEGKARKNPQKAMNALVQEEGYDPLLAKVAMDLVTKGHTDPGHAKDFRREYGFGVKHRKSQGGGGGGLEGFLDRLWD